MHMVIVDKSYLDKSKACDVKSALNDYTVLLTFELIYEIMTDSQARDPRAYLDKLVGLDLVTSRPLLNLVNKEVETSLRTGDILDPDSSQRLNDFVGNGKGMPVRPRVGAEVYNFFEKSEPERIKRQLDAMWDTRFDNVFSQQTKHADVTASARNYLCMMGSLIGNGIANEHKMTQEPIPGWLIYEWERLRNFLVFRFRLNGTRSDNLPDKKLANDLLDLHYLAFLPHVEAIATDDAKLIVPLAEILGHPNLKIMRPVATTQKL
jgi:hypothetical protein